MSKQVLYRAFMKRMESAYAASMYFECSWYAYALLEDRLVSMLSNSGGVGSKGGGGSGKPIKMMGPKLVALQERAKKDKLLAARFEYANLNTWKDDRNNLIHAMADAKVSLSDIDAKAKKLAEEGQALFRRYAADCRWLKKHRSKVAV